MLIIQAKSYLVDVANCDSRKVDLRQGLGSGLDGGDDGGLGEVLGSLEDENGRHADRGHDDRQPDDFPGPPGAPRDVVPPVEAGLFAIFPQNAAPACCELQGFFMCTSLKSQLFL